jgi:hypothetical protein
MNLSAMAYMLNNISFCQGMTSLNIQGENTVFLPILTRSPGVVEDESAWGQRPVALCGWAEKSALQPCQAYPFGHTAGSGSPVAGHSTGKGKRPPVRAAAVPRTSFPGSEPWRLVLPL